MNVCVQRNLSWQILGLLMVCCCTGLSQAQSAVSSAGVGIARSGAGTYNTAGIYVMPQPEIFRVEEFINYHRHDLPLPSGENRIRFTTQTLELADGQKLIQLGITTPRDLDPELIPPLNMVLVIDQSGSMSGERLQNVKKALKKLANRLRPQDKVCIVGFNSHASVILEATNKSRIKKINNAIEGMQAGGSTNLHAGLMLGYQQAELHFDKERSNRVILLSDGITNSGVVDTKQIADESKRFNRRGIDLSTIGLGQDLNHDLLRDLADAGRGLIHFVGDSKDIEKTFVNEVESLLAPAAKKVKLEIEFVQQDDDTFVFGYSPKRKGTRQIFRLDNLNHGATQVVLIRTNADNADEVVAKISYVDAVNGQSVTLPAESLPTKRESLHKNYGIALLAQSLHDAAGKSNDGNSESAIKLLRQGLRHSKRLSQLNTEDADYNRVRDIVKNYRTRIKDSVNGRSQTDR